MIATPAAASWRTTLNSVSHSDVESADVGSSMIRMRASSDSALAISTSCCSPIRSSAMRRCGSISMPSRFRSALAAFTMRRRSTIVPSDQRLAAEEDVLGRGQFRNQIELLMDDRDAGALGVLDAGEPDRRALDPDRRRRSRRARRRGSSSTSICRRRSRPRARGLRRSSGRSRRRAEPLHQRRFWRRLPLGGRRRAYRTSGRHRDSIDGPIGRSKPSRRGWNRRASSYPSRFRPAFQSPFPNARGRLSARF